MTKPLLMPTELRLGLVPYLNVLPLAEGLDAHIPRNQWTSAIPRELAELLSAGEIDGATLPTFEVLRAGSYEVMPRCAIACDGPVRSVQIFSKVPLQDARRILLDRSSLTSANLTRVLVADLLQTTPELETSAEPIRADFDWRGAPYDAFLVIGDVALEWEHDFPHQLDLGVGWKELTGLPFVFALWAFRPGLLWTPESIGLFRHCRESGERNAAAIARRHAGSHGLSEENLAHYLTHSVRYDLGPREWEAVGKYARRLARLGLVSGDAPRLLGPTPGP